MWTHRLVSLIALNAMVLSAAVESPEYKTTGTKPVTITTTLFYEGKILKLTAEVQNNTDDPIEDMQLCLRIEGFGDCAKTWSAGRLSSHGKAVRFEAQVDSVKRKIKEVAGEIPHRVDILIMTPEPFRAPKTQNRAANCGEFAGALKFDVDWNRSIPGWIVKPYVEPTGTAEKIYFNGLTDPSSPIREYKSRWTFSLEVPDATAVMEPTFRTFTCKPSLAIEIPALGGLTINGRDIPMDFQWIKDTSPKPPAWFKLAGKARAVPPAFMTLKGADLRIDKILSVQVFKGERWEDAWSATEVNAIQPVAGSSSLKMLIPPQRERETVKLAADAHFETNRGRIERKFFCFELVGDSEVILDDKERGDGCVDNSRTITLRITSGDHPLGSDIQFQTLGPKGEGTILAGPRHTTLSGRNLPEELRLENNSEFENGHWDLRGVSDVAISLKPKRTTLSLIFLDENGERINEPISGTVVSANGVSSQLSAGPPYTVTGQGLQIDDLRIAASSLNYEVNADLKHEADGSIHPIRMTRRALVQPTEQISISLRPFFKVRGKEQLVDAASVKVRYTDAKGPEELVLRRTPDSYVGNLTRSAGSSMVASIDLSQGQRRILASQSSYALDSIASGSQPLRVHFSKPTLSVVINPSQRFQHAKDTGWLEDIKSQAWRVFMELSDPKWDDFVAYRYLSLQRDVTQLELIKQVETTTLQASPEIRQSILGGISFSSIEVPPEKAIESYSSFMNGFSYPEKAARGVLLYIQAAGTAPLESGDASIDDLDRKLEKEGIRAVIVQLSPGSGDPKVLTRAKHHNLKLLQFYMDSESKTFFTHAFDRVISELATFKEAK